MAITEVFPNPTVKRVIFQIKFPNLFYLEQKIGDFQLKIMEKFPESSQVFRRQILFADLGPKTKLVESEDLRENETEKIWQFRSKDGVELSVLNNSIDISSTLHKTYNNEGAKIKFRDTIKFIFDSFFEVVSVPIITRLGLRYIDECPIPKKTNQAFAEYYNTTLDIERFHIENAESMEYKATIKYSDLCLNYREAFLKKGESYILILDFDGYKTDIKTEEYLAVSDRLHDLIASEFEKTIKEPVYEFMRQEPKQK
jgi:uncharacterized protein (TIGR04255 family)